MSIRLHWFLPTAGDRRDVVGFGADARSRRAQPVDYLSQVAKASRRPRLHRRAHADRHLVRGRLADDRGRWCRDTTRLKFLVAFRPGLGHADARGADGGDLPALSPTGACCSTS